MVSREHLLEPRFLEHVTPHFLPFWEEIEDFWKKTNSSSKLLDQQGISKLPSLDG